MRLDAEALRGAMRLWASGITIVTARAGGRQHGMTVSSFTSISLEPPLVLVSLAIGSLTNLLVQRSGVFGITILSAGQQEIARRFATHVPETEDRFAGLETERLVSEAPFIKGGLAQIDCKVTATHPAGTNALIIGEVVAVKSGGEDEPLVYFNREYRHLGKGHARNDRKTDPG